MDWKYKLCDVTGSTLGEFKATNRSWSPGVNRIATASCTIHETDPLYTSIVPGASHLRVYDSTETLRFFGPILSMEETGDGQVTHANLTASDLLFNLTTFFGAIDDGSTVYHYSKDGAQIAKDFIVACKNNGGIGSGGPGFKMGTITGSFPARDVTYIWKNGMEVLNEMSSIGGSFEYQIRLVDNGAAATPDSFIDLMAVVGTDRSTSVFLEYGTGKANCRSFTRTRTMERQANWVYAVGGGSPGSVRQSGAEATYGLARMDVVSYPDIADNPTLTALAQANVAARKNGREVITLTSMPTFASTPVYGTDYLYGDTISCKIMSGAGTHVNGPVRVWAVTITIDEQGNETPTWQLMP